MNPQIVVPALTIRTPEGGLDEQGTAQYAMRAVSTWVDRFILSGSTARGYSMTERERLCVLRVWLDHADPARVLACCWSRADVDNAATQGVTPIVPIPHLHNDDAALRFLASSLRSRPGRSSTVIRGVPQRSLMPSCARKLVSVIASPREQSCRRYRTARSRLSGPKPDPLSSSGTAHRGILREVSRQGPPVSSPHRSAPLHSRSHHATSRTFNPRSTRYSHT